MAGYDIRCDKCGDTKTGVKLPSETIKCQCSGEYYLVPEGSLFGEAPLFEPYYDSVLRCYVSSYREQEKLAVTHRSEAHPDGLRLVNWDRKQINEYKNISKHKEDYKASQYPGYRPGDKGAYKAERPDAHHHRGRVFSYSK